MTTPLVTLVVRPLRFRFLTQLCISLKIEYFVQLFVSILKFLHRSWPPFYSETWIASILLTLQTKRDKTSHLMVRKY